MKVIGSGIDTLVIGFCIDSWQDACDFEKLSEAKTVAGDKMFNSKGAPVEWFGVRFVISARGVHGYEWVLKNDDVTVCIARKPMSGTVIPEVYITFSQQYLWTKGAEAAYEQFLYWLSKWAIPVEDKASRCDLCIDLELALPDIDVQTEIVSRARGKAEYSLPVDLAQYFSGRRITSYRIGSGDMVARLYDKTLEIVVSRKEWFRDFWLLRGWDGVTPVTRCEFQLRRGILKEFGIKGFRDLLAYSADLWRYCSHDWLRICEYGSATNQARWKNKDYWQIIQDSYSLFGQLYGRLRKKIKNVQYHHLMQQARGLLISAAAVIASTSSKPEGIYKIKQDLKSMISSDDLRNDLEVRIARFSNMEKQPNKLIEAAIAMGAEIIDIDLDEVNS